MKKHILLIDDEQDELELLMEALKQIPVEDGFKCTYAANASHALIMLRYLVPDVIFVDMNMPGLSGLEFLARIREDHKLRTTRVYLFSSSMTESIREKASALGVTACINKANNLQHLTDALRSIFSDIVIHK